MKTKNSFILPCALLILFLFVSLNHSAQNKDAAYKEIDSLTNSGSIINAMGAIRKLEGELVKDSIKSIYWIKYGKASYNIYRSKEAKVAMEKAVSKNKKDPDAYYEKGRLHNMMRELPEAEKALSKAIELKQVGEYYYWRGIVYQQQGKNDSAMLDYDLAISKSFAAAEMFNNYSILLAEKGDYEKALSLINKAIALNPTYAQAYSARSKICFFSYRLDSACLDKERAIDYGYKNPFNIPAEICNATENVKTQYTAEILMQSKIFKQAIIGFTKLMEQYPDSSNYALNRGFCYYNLKEYDKAEKDYLKALGLKRADKKLLYSNLGLLYYDVNNFEKSIDASSKWIELDPKDYVAYVERGLSYRKLKKYKEAESDFNKSLLLKPDYFRAFGYRSFLFLELGKYEKAMHDAQKSVDIMPEYGYGYVVLGQAKKELGIDGYCIDFINGKKYNGLDAQELLNRFCK